MNFYTIKFLIQLKNAAIARKEQVIAPFNKFSFEIVKCLYKEGFVQSFEIVKSSSFHVDKKLEIKIILRFFYNKCLLSTLKVLSTPAQIRYFTLKDICKISSKKLVLFLSTNKGILTSLTCKKEKVGGTLLFIC